MCSAPGIGYWWPVNRLADSRAITVESVHSAKGMDEFIRFPFGLYKNDEHFVPPLIAERRRFFDPKRNPLFEFTDVGYFLARNGAGEVVGSVTAHINRRHNQVWNEQTGFFGFFESIEDIEAARRLLESAEAWLRQRGMKNIRGPFNFSTNDECGFLSDGFDRSPAIMMTYTKPYYLDFMRQLGYRSVKELLAYESDSSGPGPELLQRLGRRVRARNHASIRMLRMRDFDAEVSRAFQVYNSAWERNWGFVPMTEREFRFLARGLKPIIQKRFATFAEIDGQVAGFALCLPDFNQVVKKMRGRLWPFGFLHLLFAQRKIDRLRVTALGVVEEFRGRGIDILLYYEICRNYLRCTYRTCEMSWILEDNEMMNRALQRIGAVVTKRYRIFEKGL